MYMTEKNNPNTTLRLNSELKKASKKFAEDNAISGGLTGYVTKLLREDLDRHKIQWRKTPTP